MVAVFNQNPVVKLKLTQSIHLKDTDMLSQFIEKEESILMLNEVMLDYAEQDAKKANAVALKNDEIDDLEHQLNDKIFKLMQSNPERAVYYTYQLWIIHQLERIGDKVTNIAESVVFLATGKVVNFD